MTNHRDDDDERKDLTQIGDLPEFLHEEDPELDLKFGTLNPKEQEDLSNLVSLDELDNQDSFSVDDPTDSNQEDFPPELPPEVPSEIISETGIEVESISEDSPEEYSLNESEESNFEFSNDQIETSETESESVFENDSYFDNSESNETFDLNSIEETPEETVAESEEDTFSESTPNYEEQSVSIKESLSEVKNFAQNFSYGSIEGAGNPPYSVIIRNIKYEDDADDILRLLKEFKIVTESNLKENEEALRMGSILISQLSEFTAIVLVHKLRRYDLDIEAGLSDSIHPSKSGESNPRGLTKKEVLNQNKAESLKLSQMNNISNEFHTSNSASIEGHSIVQTLGIDHAHTFIDENELDRLSFIDKELRNNEIDKEDKKIYTRYKESFSKLHDELVSELKNKALKEGANALLNIQFSMNSFSDHKKTQYQINCTCTKAIVKKG